MKEINYFGGIVKILENPNQKLSDNNISRTEFRAQLPQIRNTKVIHLVFWGNLANDVANYYKINDYIIIEGYLALPEQFNLKRVEITVSKVYPFLLNSNHSNHYLSKT
jgi:hypothetical protein